MSQIILVVIFLMLSSGINGGVIRHKRYSFLENKWTVKSLSYRVSKYPSVLSKCVVDSEIKRAFDLWQEQITLEFFQQAVGPVDIEIKFEKGFHGCKTSFDGRMLDPSQQNTLAHSFGPGETKKSGDIHFDEDELWTSYSPIGKNLYQVATHEIGHVLGLDHSFIPSAVMFNTYTVYNPNFKLDCDDIEGIQSLYGKKNVESINISKYGSNHIKIPYYSGLEINAFV